MTLNKSRILIGTIACALATFANAAPAFDGNKTLNEFYKFNDSCQGALEYRTDDPNCIKRDKLADRLLANGFVRLAHDNFLPKRYIDAFDKAIQYADVQSRKVEPTQVWPIMATMVGMTRSTGATDLNILQIWCEDGLRTNFRERYPYGWALMSEAVNRIARDNARREEFQYQLLFLP